MLSVLVLQKTQHLRHRVMMQHLLPGICQPRYADTISWCPTQRKPLSFCAWVSWAIKRWAQIAESWFVRLERQRWCSGFLSLHPFNCLPSSRGPSQTGTTSFVGQDPAFTLDPLTMPVFPLRFFSPSVWSRASFNVWIPPENKSFPPDHCWFNVGTPICNAVLKLTFNPRHGEAW